MSGEDTDLGIGMGADEWFGPEVSKIEHFGYEVDGGERVDFPPEDLVEKGYEKGRPTVSAKQRQVKVAKDKTIRTWGVFTEIKPLNSDQHSHFAFPTKDPIVRVICDTGIAAVVAFPQETAKNKRETTPGRFEFTGLVKAGQEIRIRWWETEKAEQWISASESSE